MAGDWPGLGSTGVAPAPYRQDQALLAPGGLYYADDQGSFASRQPYPPTTGAMAVDDTLATFAPPAGPYDPAGPYALPASAAAAGPPFYGEGAYATGLAGYAPGPGEGVYGDDFSSGTAAAYGAADGAALQGGYSTSPYDSQYSGQYDGQYSGQYSQFTGIEEHATASTQAAGGYIEGGVVSPADSSPFQPTRFEDPSADSSAFQPGEFGDPSPFLSGYGEAGAYPVQWLPGARHMSTLCPKTAAGLQAMAL